MCLLKIGLFRKIFKMAKLAKVTLKDIPEFQRTNVHMKNPLEVERKINVILDGGFQQLQIVSDFDQTITKQRNENGKNPLSSFSKLNISGSN